MPWCLSGVSVMWHSPSLDVLAGVSVLCHSPSLNILAGVSVLWHSPSLGVLAGVSMLWHSLGQDKCSVWKGPFHKLFVLSKTGQSFSGRHPQGYAILCPWPLHLLVRAAGGEEGEGPEGEGEEEGGEGGQEGQGEGQGEEEEQAWTHGLEARSAPNKWALSASSFFVCFLYFISLSFPPGQSGLGSFWKFGETRAPFFKPGKVVWSLLHSASLRSRADSLCLHVTLYEWLAFYSTFLNIHGSGVLTALAWLMPHETAAISAQVLCTPYNHAPCHFMVGGNGNFGCLGKCCYFVIMVNR